MSTQAEFQSEFTNYLLAERLPIMPPRMQAAMTVYRNTVMRGWIDALAANYPTILKLVGNEWFEAAASEFCRRHHSNTPVLAELGASFPSFIAEFPPAFDLPYLSEVANIDRNWMKSNFAADTASLPVSIFQGLSGDQLMSTRLQLHPATRLVACKHSAVSIWLHNFHNNVDELTIDDSDQDALITRLPEGIVVTPLCMIEFRFLTEIQNSKALGEAAVTALGINPEFPLAATLAKLINLGCFADVSPKPRTQT